MHEVFLQRMAAHPVLRTDVNFKVFLEYEPEVLSSFQILTHVVLMFPILINFCIFSLCQHKMIYLQLTGFFVVWRGCR